MTPREEYRKNGYAVFRGDCICEANQINAATSNFLDRVIKHRGCGVENQLSIEEKMKIIYSQDLELYVSCLRMIPNLWSNYESFIRPKIVECIQDIYFSNPCVSESPVLHVMSPYLKIPGGYYGTGAHQDWASMQGSLDSFTIWMALTDADVGNFPLEVIPGSHLGGLRNGKMNGSVLEIALSEEEERSFVPIECEPGDIIIMSGFTIHRTGKGNNFRMAMSRRFESSSEPTFMDRKFPCAQKRTVDREIKWAPTVEQVRKIFA